MIAVIQLTDEMIKKIQEFQETRSITLAVEIVDSLVVDVK